MLPTLAKLRIIKTSLTGTHIALTHCDAVSPSFVSQQSPPKLTRLIYLSSLTKFIEDRLIGFN